MENIKVAIVEDNPFLREGLIYLMNGTLGFQCVGAYPDAENIVHHIGQDAPDIVLMDIGLPNKMNGIEATRHLKAHFPKLSILIQTVREDSFSIFSAFKAGASGYLLKNLPPNQLLQTIRETVEGHLPKMLPHIAQKWIRFGNAVFIFFVIKKLLITVTI
jgi:DNA-binding NarL/FixJ family response regulator